MSKFDETWRGFKYLQSFIDTWEAQMNTNSDFATRKSGFDTLRLTLNQLVWVLEEVERSEDDEEISQGSLR